MVCDLDLIVSVQKRNLEVFADSYSPHDLTVAARHDPGGGFYNWTIDRPLLAYQSIYITWKPKNSNVTLLNMPTDTPERAQQEPGQT